MELAHTLTWKGFTMDTLRDKIRENTRKETKKQVCRYEGTARIKEQNSGYCELEDFTL